MSDSNVLTSSLDVMLPKHLSLGFPKLSLENPTVYPNQPEICLHKGRKRRADSQSLADSESTKIPKAQLRRFVGFVNHKVEKKAALYFASKIYELPVPESVTHRMVVWTSGILHEGSGAVGVVWMKAPHGTEAPIPWTTNPTTSIVSPATWEVKGRKYPGKRITDNTVGHFSLATAIDLALEELDRPFSNAMHHCKPDNQVYQHLSQNFRVEVTDSNCHTKPKELFVFTDDHNIMEALRSKRPPRNEEAREHLEKTKTLSERIEMSGVHLEIHYCCNRQRFPGKYLASEKAKDVIKVRREGNPSSSKVDSYK